MYLGLFDYAQGTIGRELYEPPLPVTPIGPTGYARQPISFGAPDGNGWVTNTSTVTMGGPPLVPIFGSPFTHPNAWYAMIVALCSGNVIGTKDVIAWGLAYSGNIPWALLAGESLAFPAGKVRYRSSTQELVIGDVPNFGAIVTPARSPGGVLDANPVGDDEHPLNGVCYRARFQQWVLQWGHWYNSTPTGLKSPIDIVALQQFADAAQAEADAAGCPAFP